jgi:hypothetical protein
MQKHVCQREISQGGPGGPSTHRHRHTLAQAQAHRHIGTQTHAHKHIGTHVFGNESIMVPACTYVCITEFVRPVYHPVLHKAYTVGGEAVL